MHQVTAKIVTTNAAGEEETTYKSTGLKPEDP